MCGGQGICRSSGYGYRTHNYLIKVVEKVQLTACIAVGTEKNPDSFHCSPISYHETINRPSKLSTAKLPLRPATDAIVCLLAGPRCGSTALRQVLEQSRALVDFGEIFHSDVSLARFPFISFLRSWPDPVTALLDRVEGERLGNAYLDRLGFEAQPRAPLIDIKHNAWNVLRPLWSFPQDEPRFLRLLKRRDCRFIVLTRDNLAEQVISLHLASLSGLWHSPLAVDSIPERSRRASMDVSAAAQLARRLAGAEELIVSFLDDYQHVLRLSYESTFENGQVTNRVASALSDFLGVELTTLTPGLRQNPPIKRQLIGNYDEVVAAVTSATRLRPLGPAALQGRS